MITHVNNTFLSTMVTLMDQSWARRELLCQYRAMSQETHSRVHSSIETGPLKHPSNSDPLYSKLEIMVADTHPHSQTEYHCNGLGVDGLQTMRPPHRSLSSHTPYHGNVQISHFYDTVALPLKDRTDAILFRHYIQKIAISVRNKSGVGGI